jgi:hypothetical protein
LVVAPARPKDKKCKVTPALLKSTFNSYVMNKEQNTKKNNTIDLTDSKVTKKMGKPAVSLMQINANIWCFNDFSLKLVLRQLLPRSIWRGRFERKNLVVMF